MVVQDTRDSRKASVALGIWTSMMGHNICLNLNVNPECGGGVVGTNAICKIQLFEMCIISQYHIDVAYAHTY
jgi:hypothetical protein